MRKILLGMLTLLSVGISARQSEDYYLEGYIQSLADSYDRACGIDVVVKDHTVYLSRLPNNRYLVEHLVEDIQKLPCIRCVQILDCPPKECGNVGYIKHIQKWEYCCSGVWFPQSYNVIWQPLIADPRQPMYSAAYRVGDKVVGQTLAAVSFADNFPIYRWCSLWAPGGELQLGIEGGVFALFNLNTYSHDLVNADYYCGLPLIYAYGPWSFRLRLYHISSHLGDEYLLAHPGIVRTNPSEEALDFFASYQITSEIRLYGGVGDYLISDPSFHESPLYLAYGFEIKTPWYYDYCRSLKWVPYMAVYIRNRATDQWIFDQTYSVGMEVGPIYGNVQKVRFSLEWHDGVVPDGQLSRFRTSYGQVKFAYDW